MTSKTIQNTPPTSASHPQLSSITHLTKTYLLTRRTKNSPPSEIDELRLALDYRRLMVRVRRYPIYFTDHLRDSLSPYEYAIKDAYQIDIEKLIQGLEEI